ncbi:hypothetical protein B0H14DRAFT_2636004 [Mycena olivaceomarginata]|nr:hypothetical protein B0H14DRAFT_2636004 [Mycena olivaceomarginata]
MSLTHFPQAHRSSAALGLFIRFLSFCEKRAALNPSHYSLFFFQCFRIPPSAFVFNSTLRASTIARDAPLMHQHFDPNKGIVSGARFGFSIVAQLPNVRFGRHSLRNSGHILYVLHGPQDSDLSFICLPSASRIHGIRPVYATPDVAGLAI